MGLEPTTAWTTTRSSSVERPARYSRSPHRGRTARTQLEAPAGSDQLWNAAARSRHRAAQGDSACAAPSKPPGDINQPDRDVIGLPTSRLATAEQTVERSQTR